MADIRPFSGFRLDPKSAPLKRVLCPPYDVIDAEMAAMLRSDELSAVHLELPAGEGEAKYAAAKQRWDAWQRQGLLKCETSPAFYVVEERYKAQGKARARTGFLAALSVKPEHAPFVLAHEKTLSKPKEDRLKLLSAVKANISPIFGLLPDPGGKLRAALKKAKAAKPAASGTMGSGVAYKLWALTDEKLIAAVVRAAAPRQILIADGHHRYEVSRAYCAMNPGDKGAETVLAYLCPEGDPGLIVLPTHRITPNLLAKAGELARLEPAKTPKAMLAALARKKNPYAFGLYAGGKYFVAEPKSKNGCKSGLCVEWLGANLLGGVAPDEIKYSPDAAKSVTLAAAAGADVAFVKPMEVPMIRKAVKAVGLLPQKSTYFFPKIATGLVFKSLE
jgi:uncharacterized protein (DUF1015 family)